MGTTLYICQFAIENYDNMMRTKIKTSRNASNILIAYFSVKFDGGHGKYLKIRLGLNFIINNAYAA